MNVSHNNIHISEQELDLIDQYLSGRLSGPEKLAFEEQLASSEDWAAKVHQVKLISAGIQESILREKIDSYHEQVPVAKHLAPVKRINLLTRIAAAASVVFVVSLLSWLLFFRSSANEKLFSDFFQKDPGLSTEMGVSDNYDFDRAMVDYKTEHYKEAVERWSRLLATNANNDTLHYFIASAQLAGNNPSVAIPHFDNVLKTAGSVFTDDALWYKGLALLKTGKKQEAIAVIEKSQHPQKQALLLKLKD